MLTKDVFLQQIQTVFEEESRQFINFQTDLKSLPEWSSLQAMIVVSEIDKAFDVILSAEDMKQAKTLNDLFESVKQKAV